MGTALNTYTIALFYFSNKGIIMKIECAKFQSNDKQVHFHTNLRKTTHQTSQKSIFMKDLRQHKPKKNIKPHFNSISLVIKVSGVVEKKSVI